MTTKPVPQRNGSAYIYSRFADKFRHAHLKNSNPANGYPQILSENNCFGGIGRVLEEMQKNGFAGWIVSETDYKKARSKTEGTGMLLSDVTYIKKISSEGIKAGEDNQKIPLK